MKDLQEIAESMLSILEASLKTEGIPKQTRYDLLVQKQELEERIKDLKRIENGL